MHNHNHFLCQTLSLSYLLQPGSVVSVEGTISPENNMWRFFLKSLKYSKIKNQNAYLFQRMCFWFPWNWNLRLCPSLVTEASYSTWNFFFFFLHRLLYCLPYFRGSLSAGRLERRMKLLRLFKYAGIVWWPSGLNQTYTRASTNTHTDTHRETITPTAQGM